LSVRLDYQNKAAAFRERPGTLDSLLGLKDTELLQLLASEVGGTYMPPKLFQGERVEVRFGQWLLSFDYGVPSKISGTRVLCSYRSPDGFRLRALPNNFVCRWLRLSRWPTLRTGIPLIDDSLLLSGTDAMKLQQVFADPHVLACLQSQPPGWIDFGTIWPRGLRKAEAGVLQLEVLLRTRTIHAGHLSRLLDFSAALMDRLAFVGSAQPCSNKAAS
jgi:hypothetical protein